MPIKNAIGRPPKMSMKIVNKLADSISHNYNVSDSVKYAKISRSTYYHYLNNEPLFAEAMVLAHRNQRKVSFNFRTLY